MRHRTTSTVYGTWLKLVKKTNPKTGRKHYSVTANLYDYVGWAQAGSIDTTVIHRAWQDHFDPNHNRGPKAGFSWKFSNKQEAEQLITLALLRWGERHVA